MHLILSPTFSYFVLLVRLQYFSFPHCSDSGGLWYGVDILNEDIADNFEAFVWEPSVVKINAITAAAEATCLILSVDETIRNPKAGGEEGGPGMGRGGVDPCKPCLL